MVLFVLGILLSRSVFFFWVSGCGLHPSQMQTIFMLVQVQMECAYMLVQMNNLMQSGWFPYSIFFLFIPKIKVCLWHLRSSFRSEILLSFFVLIDQWMNKNAWHALMNVYGCMWWMSYPKNATVHLRQTFIFFLEGLTLDLELLESWILCLFKHSFFYFTHICFFQNAWC